MNYQYVMLLTLSSMLLIGCGEDSSSNRFTKNPQPIITEVYTVYSGIHREKGTAPLTYKQETALNSDASTIRPIPDIRFDDEGGDGKNATSRRALTRPSFPCGQTSTLTLKEKIADCALKEKNGTLATWSGTIHANSAESIWNLVVLSKDENGVYEIWIDEKTGMLWSQILPRSNWCAASGSSLYETDTVGINCATTGNGQSLCTNLNLAELPKVNWRLPTRHDFLQADIDGIRFVLPEGTDVFWTATVSSDVEKRNKAWTYSMAQGTLAAHLMNTNQLIRCIGTPNF